MQEQLKTVRTMLIKGNANPEDVFKKLESLEKEISDTYNKVKKLEKELNLWKKQEIHKYVAPTSGTIVQNFEQNVDTAFKDKKNRKGKVYKEEYVLNPVKKGGDFVAKIVDSHGIKVKQGISLPQMIQSNEKRGSYNNVTNKIDIGNQSGVDGTVAHEMGHFLEDNNQVIKNECQQFFNQITLGGTDELLSEALKDSRYGEERYRTTNISMPEYATKIMSDGTELFSVGMEELYKNPVRFSQDYPEYFNFIVSLIKKVSTI